MRQNQRWGAMVGHWTEGKPGTRKTRYGKQQQMRIGKRLGGRR